MTADSVRWLLSSIRAPKIAETAAELVRLAQVALHDLEGLDESLYHRFKDSEGELGEDTGAVMTVRALMNGTFKGLRALLSYCRQLRPEVENPGSEGADFSFGDLEAAGSAGTDDLSLGLGDIGALLDGIDEHKPQTEAQRFAALIETISSIEYGLTSQVAEVEGRVKLSLNDREIPSAIEAIDDTQGTTTQGVFAVLTALCETFAPGLEPASLAPGHLTLLQRALLVRRGLADLARALAGPHDQLQLAPSDEALLGVRKALSTFIASEAFSMMRPADRWQLSHFDQTLASQPVSAARFTSEGLSKYLESLSSINKREVLVTHDRRAANELREAKSAAEQLALIGPRLALESAQTAVQAALSLYGRSLDLDQAILGLPERMVTVERLPETFAALDRMGALLP